MFRFFKKDTEYEYSNLSNDSQDNDLIIDDEEEYEEYMDELEDSLNNETLTFEQVKIKLKERTPNYKEIVDYTGKILSISIISNEEGSSFITAIILTNNGHLISENIEEIKINNFNPEDNVNPDIIGRKIYILDVDRYRIVYNTLF